MNPDRRNDARLRLLNIKERTALKGEQMAEERERFAALAARHGNGLAPVAVASFQLFQTPSVIAAYMVRLAGLKDGMRVLEPSAGLGRILSAIADDPAQLAEVVAVEQSPDCCRELYRQRRNATLRQADFLELARSPSLGRFDRVIMNPPFSRGLDYKHTLAARALLTPGGRLVGLCYAGARIPALQALASHWEELPPNSFAAEGTRAGVCLFTIDT